MSKRSTGHLRLVRRPPNGDRDGHVDRLVRQRRTAGDSPRPGLAQKCRGADLVRKAVRDCALIEPRERWQSGLSEAPRKRRGGPARGSATSRAASWIRSSFSLETRRSRRRNGTSGANRNCASPSTTRSASSRNASPDLPNAEGGSLKVRPWRLMRRRLSASWIAAPASPRRASPRWDRSFSFSGVRRLARTWKASGLGACRRVYL